MSEGTMNQTAIDILDAATGMLNGGPEGLMLRSLLPASAVGAVDVAAIVLRAADGALHELSGTGITAATGAAAGAAADKAARMAGLQHAVEQHVTELLVGQAAIADVVSAIMSEVGRRMR